MPMFLVEVFDRNHKLIHREVKRFADIKSAEKYARESKDWLCHDGYYYVTAQNKSLYRFHGGVC